MSLFNLARMTVSSSGTGTITLNVAVSGFLTFDLAGCSTASTGQAVTYAISDTTQSEIAYGTYTSSSLTLTRGSSLNGMKSTNSNSPINMSNAAQVLVTPNAADMSNNVTVQTLTSTAGGTYSKPTNCVAIWVRLQGSGGGGAGAGSSGATAGSSGGTSTFGPLTATGGLGGPVYNSGAASIGGVGAGGDINTNGSAGTSGTAGSSITISNGGAGGSGVFGGGGFGGALAIGATAGLNGGGGGGGGLTTVSGGGGGSGGGAGGFSEKVITSPSTSYSWTIGSGGSAGAAGAGGNAGAAGGSGIIIVHEYYGVI